jgi:predicted negative regulator of RcsB-dependent stress response
MKKFLLLLVLFTLGASAQVTVGLKSGKTVEGETVKNNAGKIVITMETGTSRTLSIKEIAYVNSPRPSYIDKLVKATYAKKYDLVLSTEKYLKDYSKLGWGHYGYLFYARALVAKGKIDEARKALRTGRITSINSSNKLRDTSYIYTALIEVEVAAKDFSKADEYLAKLKTFDSEARKFFYNARGDYHKAKGDNNRAVLDYYKVALFERKGDPERNAALRKIKAIYTELNDPRVNDLKNL